MIERPLEIGDMPLANAKHPYVVKKVLRIVVQKVLRSVPTQICGGPLQSLATFTGAEKVRQGTVLASGCSSDWCPIK